MLFVVGIVVCAFVQEAVGDLLEAFKAEIETAEHQQDRHQDRQHRGYQQGRRNQDQLVEEATLGHRPHHRDFTLRPHAGDFLRVDGQIVAQHAGGFLCRHLGH